MRVTKNHCRIPRSNGREKKERIRWWMELKMVAGLAKLWPPEWEGVEATFTRKETSGQTFLRPLSFDLQHLRIAPFD